ncbi:hypothetical protein [Streptomyces sp. NPDC056387]|uniref:hypothetical protein n=1 Tax=Streptomyces sp. NPDC056387 TaxID=3345803 RepID=UPI0035DDC0AA
MAGNSSGGSTAVAAWRPARASAPGPRIRAWPTHPRLARASAPDPRIRAGTDTDGGLFPSAPAAVR